MAPKRKKTVMNNDINNWKEASEKMRNQKDCLCCWAIVVAAAIESRYNIIDKPSGENITVSPHDLLDNYLTDDQAEQLGKDGTCLEEMGVSPVGPRGCFSARPIEVLRSVIKYGCVEESNSNQFIAKKQCNTPNRKAEFKVGNLEEISDIWEAVGKQPVIATLLLTQAFYNLKNDSIYKGSIRAKDLKDNSYHSVLVVGPGKKKLKEKW
ncbi:uncharacterized protein [Arachis hypogaea]|uniref:uncharacterized protein isoform X3 n=2 Tax=Arachis hypogaea TaxID=3818 RepID=UPI000DED048C|nr:uncharacterized protein LOC112705527 [Arachis hypogaea]